MIDQQLEISSIIPYFDGFISDYSGAASDAMLADKPIGYFVDDIDVFSVRKYNGFS